MKKIIWVLCLVFLLHPLTVYAEAITGIDGAAGIILAENYYEYSEWAHAELEKAEQYGLIADSIRKKMNAPINREEFAELAVRLVEVYTGKTLKAAPSDTFTDTANIAVLKAYGCGIVNGVGNGRFDPKAYTNREQIATMTGRTIQVIAPDKAATYINISMFNDDEQVADYAKPYVKFMAQNGYIKGGSDGYFRPKDNCTREQAVLIITRIFESLGGTAPPNQVTNPFGPANGGSNSSREESATNSRTIIGTWSTHDNLGDFFESGTGRYLATEYYILAFVFREDGTFTRYFITSMGNTQTQGRYKFVEGEPERYPGGRKIMVYDQRYKFYNSKGELGETGEEDDEVFDVRYNPEDDTLNTNWLAGNRLKRIN